MAQKKIALFIDADNISFKFGKHIIATLESRGELFIRRIYGNWEKPSLHGWNDCIRDFALRPVQQTDFVTGKNATDMSLTIDAMDVLHRDNVEIFALVTNDSDFTPLVIRLREGGMNIIGFGNANASNAFRAACNEFIDLNTLSVVKTVNQPVAVKKISSAPVKPPVAVKKISTAPIKPPVSEKKSSVQLSLFDYVDVEHEPPKPPVTANPKVISLDERKLQSERDKKIQLMHEVLQDSAIVHAKADGFTSINYARQDVRKKNFDFTVHDFGYGQLKDFIAAYPKLYEIRQDDNGQKFFYRYRKNDKPDKSDKPAQIVKPAVEDDRLKQMHEVLREAVVIAADSDGFANLSTIGMYISQQNLGFNVKTLGYGTLQKFFAAFPDMYELRQTEDTSYVRCLVSDSNLPDNALDRLQEVLHEATLLAADDDGFADMSDVENYILQQNLGFSVKALGFRTLQKFIAAFPDLYELQGDKIRCRESKLPDDALDRLQDAMREAVTTNADDNGFANLCAVGNFIVKKNIGSYVKGLGYGTLQKFIAAFPDLYELQDDKIRCRTSEPEIHDDVLNQLHNVLYDTAALHEDSDGFVNLWWACDFIMSKKNLVNEIKSMTYKDLIEFLNDFPDSYEIRHERGQDLCYRCRTIKPPHVDKFQKLHNVLQETAKVHGDAKGFAQLSQAGVAILEKNLTIKGSGHGSLQKFLSAFPKLYEVQKLGQTLCYRCRQSQK